MADNTEAMPVTVIGMGAMGRALAGAQLSDGRPVTVWNRTPGRTGELETRGARVAGTVAEALAASPLVVVCVVNYDAMYEVLSPVAGSLTGRTLVNLTSGTPRQAREAAEWAARHGAAYLDGGIMAVPPMIGGPSALILYSGSPQAFELGEAAFAELGTARYLGADAGRAALYDLALLSAMYGMFGGVYHALALTGSEQVPATEFTPMIVSWLTAMLAQLPATAELIDAGETSKADSNLEMQAVGYVNLLDASRDQGVRTDFVTPMRDLLNRAVAAGPGVSLVDLLRAEA